MNAQAREIMPDRAAASTPLEVLSANLLATVLTLVPAGVAVLNEAGEYVMVSPGFTRHFGWQRTQVVGRRFTDFLDDKDGIEAVTRHAAAQEPGSEFERAGRHRRADGSVVAVHVHSRTVASSGHLYRVVLIQPEPAPAPRLVAAGRLQVIGLDRVREHLGGRWDAVAQRAFATAESVIRRRLDRLDVVSRTADGFVVCFAGLSANEAAFKAAALSDEITRRLVGEVAESAARTVGFAAEVSLPPDVAEHAVGEALHRGLVDAQARALSNCSGILQQAAACATLRPEPILQTTGRHSGIVIAEMDDGVGGQLERLAALGWTGQDPDLPAELLLLRLRLACAWGAAAERTTVIVPGPWASLCQRRVLERLARLLLEVPRPVRERVGFEIRDVPTDAPRARLFELVSTLTALSRAPSVELPAPAASGVLEGIVQRLDLVTMHADSLFLPGLARAEVLVRELTDWRARLLVRAVDQEEQFTALYAMGVPLVAGRALDGGDPRG